MADHKQPTKEELEAEIKKTQAALEEVPPKETPPSTEEEIEEPEEETTEEETEDETPEEDAEEEEEEQPEAVDYKKKFVESSREAQVIAARDKKLEDAIAAGAELPEPTDEEMEAIHKDWEVLSDFEQSLAKENFISKKRFELLDNVRLERRDIDSWNEKVDKYVDNPKTLIDTPDLEGKQAEFKIFATKPTRRGVDFETLVAAFLHDASKTRIKHKGQMFEKGTGGPSTKHKADDTIGPDEAAALMDKDYNKYKKLLLAGKIRNV